MHEKGIVPDVITYSCMIYGFCISGRWSDGERLLREMVETDINPNVVKHIDQCIGQRRQVHCADELYSEMLHMGVYPNTVTYNSMIDGLCRQNRLDEAKRTFDSMGSKGCSPKVVTFTTLINGYCKAGKVDDGMELAHEMYQRGIVADEVTYKTLIYGFRHVGH